MAGTLGDYRVIGARAVVRPELQDLYLRIDVNRLPVATGMTAALAPIVYGMRFSTRSGDYELRATAYPALDKVAVPSFQLLRRVDGSSWQVIDDMVRGGYGTTGESIVAAIPLGVLGADVSDRLHDVEVFERLAHPAWAGGL